MEHALQRAGQRRVPAVRPQVHLPPDGAALQVHLHEQARRRPLAGAALLLARLLGGLRAGQGQVALSERAHRRPPHRLWRRLLLRLLQGRLLLPGGQAPRVRSHTEPWTIAAIV